MASRTDRFIEDKFSTRVNPKNGFAVADCREGRDRQVLEFLVPFLYLENPTRVTITIGNTIFGALSGERPLDWSQVMRDVMQRIVAGMGRSKATPLYPYVFHLYHMHKVLLPNEEYWIVEALLKHNIKPKEEKILEASKDSNCKSLSSKEIQEI